MNKNNQCDSEALVLYHYQELNNEEISRVEAHLNLCHKCRTELQTIENTLAKVPSMEIKIDTIEKQHFRARVLTKHKHRSLKKPVWGSALVAAGALMVALIILPGTDSKQNQTFSDLEILDQMELLQEFELLQNFEIYEELGNIR
jgi:anti-sigma factor RsiW